jgi:hypothetical protein
MKEYTCHIAVNELVKKRSYNKSLFTNFLEYARYVKL